MKYWVAILFWLCLHPASAQDFVAGDIDVPLMPGLTETKREALLFDAPGGRVVETEIAGAVAIAAALDFYRQSLPPLGWRPRPLPQGLAFEREHERLELAFTTESGILHIRISLAPKS